MKLSKALDEFLNLQIVKGNSQETYDTYKKRIGYFIDFCYDKDCCELSIKDYNEYVLFLRNKKISSQTIKTRLNDVRIFIHFLVKNNYVVDTFEIPTYKAGKKTIVVLSPEEIIRLLNYFDRNSFYGVRDLFIVSLMLDCGLRVSEVLNLSVNDFCFNNFTIRVHGKGAKERLVPLTGFVIYCYNQYIIYYNTLDKLFNLTTSGVRQIFKRINKNLGFNKFHPHFLRHTFATYFLLHGGDSLSLQTILGHETLYMTQHYVHIANQMSIAKQSTFSPLSNFYEMFISKKD